MKIITLEHNAKTQPSNVVQIAQKGTRGEWEAGLIEWEVKSRRLHHEVTSKQFC